MRFEKLHLKDFITLGVAGFGFLAVYYAFIEYALSALFVVISVFLDFLDGRIARHTGKHNDFGRELDSLSDAVAFGAAPAFAALTFAPPEWFMAHFASAVVYFWAVLIRLARFNIQETKGHYFGLPSPAAAVLLLILAPIFQAYTPVVYLILAFLMLGEFQLKKP
ncbi:CDP-diacylglycerol--serine O-phosphatidyltransferase [Candidatus Micrarchaeota archaeon]|nr:CDP-diacylglycerol--serine O-phosphatidyltransferase [Candidatus Micrarchaeota archaeon]